MGDAVGDANAPTVLNSSLNFRQFWNGRAASLEDQAEGPLLNPKEMNSNWQKILALLQSDRDYKEQFEEAYGEPPKAEHVKDAIAVFERSLITLDSPLDRYLKGEKGALSTNQLAGMRKFRTLGCVSCHQGKAFGGNMFQRIGVAEDYFKLRGGEKLPSDLGRYSVTGREEDRHVFKVPSLRNVELTAPYFHDGSAKTLEDAVRTMARVQLGRRLSATDIRDLVAFLKSLTGRLPDSAFANAERGPR